MTRPDVTRQLAEGVARSSPMRTARAVAAAKAGILDWFASALAGRADVGVHAIEEALRSEGGASVATVLGRAYRTGPLTAALLNGYLGHALDYDDVHASMRGHPSTVVLPALLALAEERRSSGADFLTAYIVGVEIMCRLGLALGSQHYDAGWHSTATLGAIGAAAACGRLLQLDVEAMCHALGLAATQASGLRVHFGTPAKPLHAGLAARSGLLAAKLAATGLTGAPDALGGPNGFLAVFGGDMVRSDSVLDGLGEWGDVWQIADPGLWFKAYPCCSAAHHAADAALAIRAARRFDPQAIDAITITFPPGGDAALTVREPSTGVEGRFSVEYVVAAALVDGELGIATFADGPVRSELKAVAAKVRRTYDASIAPAPNAVPPGRFTVVTVSLIDGTSYTERVDCPRGAPGYPLSAEERLTKYRDAAQGLSDGWMELPTMVDRLETLPDVSRIIAHG